MSQKTYGFLSAIPDVDLPVTDHVYIFMVCSSATFDRRQKFFDLICSPTQHDRYLKTSVLFGE